MPERQTERRICNPPSFSRGKRKGRKAEMSFLSIFKTVGLDILKVAGVGLNVAQIAAPMVGFVMSPAASAILGKINAAVTGAELLIQGAQAGVAKNQSAVQIAISEIPTLEAVIQELGPGVQLDTGAVNDAVNAA